MKLVQPFHPVVKCELIDTLWNVNISMSWSPK